ncbi:hypothetical protein [Salibacterium qingdaonense]|uniref:Uncharacterized protein n=1 Tax=Salibacterium qingdaonense TaxID=266892 RepID=A0A1I4MJK8_9BACI|nr:hypothetical protein [Salibacterium qingdaonense]SFM03388.1 hypothetical protein SAMN04488054_11229 [Salibacterium qingdaonense]
MSYHVYKGEVTHPEHHLPLLIYYNAEEETFCFSTVDFQENRPPICDFQYPAKSIKEVRTFLKKIGMDAENVEFKTQFLH